MWDGSFKTTRQVSMRGKSAREENRKTLTARVKQDRERRRREKLEQSAGATLNRVGISFVVRQRARRNAIAEWARKTHDVARVQASVPGFKVPLPVLSNLAKLLVFGYENRHHDDDLARDAVVGVENMLHFCSWLEQARQQQQVIDLRPLALAVVLLDYLQDALYNNLSHIQKRGGSASVDDLVAALASTLTIWLEGDERRNVRLVLVDPSRPTGRCAGSVTAVLHGLVTLGGLESRSDEVSLAQLLCTAVAEFVDDASASSGDRNPLLIDEVMHEFACAALCIDAKQLQRLGLEDLMRSRFSAHAWAATLRGMRALSESGSGSEEDAHILANSIRISRACANDDPARQDLRAAYWRSVGYMLMGSRHGHILETLPELQQLREPTMVAQEFYAVLEPEPNLDLALAVCSAYEVIRRFWTKPPTKAAGDTRSAARSLNVLSASGVVVGAVAFSPHDRSIVRMLWSLLVDFVDDRGLVDPALFGADRFDEVCSTITFACAATCQLLPALDDEEIFVKGVPLSVDLLQNIAHFLKHVLYEGLWEQKGEIASPASRSEFPEVMLTKCAELYDQLFERHCRHPIMDDPEWLFPNISEVELGISLTASGPGPMPAPLRRIPRLIEAIRPAMAWTNASPAPRPQFMGAQAGAAADENDVMDLGSDDSDREDSDSEVEDASGITPENASERVKQLLRTLPETVPFEQRTRVFAHFLRTDRRSVAGRFEHNAFIRLAVRRGHVYDDAFDALAGSGPLKARIQVQFENQQGLVERGIDGGGLFKEFLIDFMREAFSLDNGLWKATVNQEIYPNPDRSCATLARLRDYEFIGTMLGKAVYEGILLELSLAPFFLNSILGRRNHLHDLQSLDPEIYRNVIHLKSMQNPSTLGLTFSAACTRDGVSEETDLIPNGSNIEVTAANYMQYVLRLSSFRLNEEFRPQTEAFLAGFSSMISEKWIQMFKPREMQLVIGGSDDGYSVKEMRAHCTYSHGYHPSQPYVQDFWDIVSNMDKEERGLLLRFITSCSKPPLQGFRSLKPPLCIGCVNINSDTERLPTASTCVNFLKLPKYSSKDVLREKLLFAIKSSSGFELS